MAKKGNRIQVILECTEHKATGQPGTSRYITTKNKKNTPDRMEIKKFNPILKRMTVHKEIKYTRHGKKISSNTPNWIIAINKSYQDGQISKNWCIHFCGIYNVT